MTEHFPNVGKAMDIRIHEALEFLDCKKVKPKHIEIDKSQRKGEQFENGNKKTTLSYTQTPP